MKLVLASNNAKKLAELQRILEPLVDSIDVVAAQSVGYRDDPVEDADSFAGNALIKARACCAATGLPSIADDSGLCVDALNGMPGVLSARWSGHRGPRDEIDAANNALLLAQISDVPPERRGAQFVCTMALCFPDGTEIVRSGQMPGRILPAERGTGGFGYDPLFAPDGLDVSSAELTAEQKDAISHRGAALRAIAPDIAEVLGRKQ